MSASTSSRNGNFNCLPVLHEEEIRQCILRYTRRKVLFSTAVARKMKFESIVPSFAFHYSFKNMWEERDMYKIKTPWNDSDGDKKVDGPTNGPHHGKWDVVINSPSFDEIDITASDKMRVPHSEVIVPCDGCNGIAKADCRECKGRGRQSCCHDSNCQYCNGKGSHRCWKCNSTGKVKCKCEGSGRLLEYQEIKVKWEVFTQDVVSTKNVQEKVGVTVGLKDKKIMKRSGPILVEELDTRVKPLWKFPDKCVAKASQEAIMKLSSVPRRHIRKQRQTVREIPVIVVKYTVDGQRGHFLIYGEERKVHFDNYPKRCVIL